MRSLSPLSLGSWGTDTRFTAELWNQRTQVLDQICLWLSGVKLDKPALRFLSEAFTHGHCDGTWQALRGFSVAPGVRSSLVGGRFHCIPHLMFWETNYAVPEGPSTQYLRLLAETCLARVRNRKPSALGAWTLKHSEVCSYAKTILGINLFEDQELTGFH